MDQLSNEKHDGMKQEWEQRYPGFVYSIVCFEMITYHSLLQISVEYSQRPAALKYPALKRSYEAYPSRRMIMVLWEQYVTLTIWPICTVSDSSFLETWPFGLAKQGFSKGYGWLLDNSLQILFGGTSCKDLRGRVFGMYISFMLLRREDVSL